MDSMIRFWRDHGTKLLGALGTVQSIILAFMAIDGLIPGAQIKYWAAAGAVLGALTVRRGFVNSAQR